MVLVLHTLKNILIHRNSTSLYLILWNDTYTYTFVPDNDKQNCTVVISALILVLWYGCFWILVICFTFHLISPHNTSNIKACNYHFILNISYLKPVVLHQNLKPQNSNFPSYICATIFYLLLSPLYYICSVNYITTNLSYFNFITYHLISKDCTSHF